MVLKYSEDNKTNLIGWNKYVHPFLKTDLDPNSNSVIAINLQWKLAILNVDA